MTRFLALLLLLGVAIVGVAPARSQVASSAPDLRDARLERRVALVIGNQEYRHVTRLRTAVADARAMSARLRERGFETFEGYDLDRSQMNRLFARFEAALVPGTVAVFYFAGHGVQVAGNNVLLPVDLSAAGERDLLDDGVLLPQYIDRMASANGRRGGGFNLLIVDACRDNPFQAPGRAIGIVRGIAPTGSSGVMVVYSAGSNQQALDGLGSADQDPNGLFTRLLIREMQTPGLSVRDMVGRVRAQVASAARSVGHEQVPAIYDEAVGDFVFSPVAAVPPAAPPAPPQERSAALAAPASPAGTDREMLFWQSILSSSNASDFEAYLRVFPDGTFAPLARNRLAGLAALAPKPTPAPAVPGEAKPAELTPGQRSALRRGLRALGYHKGGETSDPLDESARVALRRYQKSIGAAETGVVAPVDLATLEEGAARLAVLLDQPPRSPRGTAAETAATTADRFARGRAADDPARGASRDPSEAAYWYALAARGGEPRAYTQLGLLIARREAGGISTLTSDAIWLWRAAAGRGEGAAMFNLGAAYEHGIGVAANQDEARRWYGFAVEQRQAGAVVALQRVRR